MAETHNIDGRETRGLIIAATKKLTQKGGVWLVPSESGAGKYTVVPHATEPHCTCPDHETRGVVCKHIHAVRITITREQNEDGSVTETRTLTVTEKRTTYPQNWPFVGKALPCLRVIHDDYERRLKVWQQFMCDAEIDRKTTFSGIG